MAEEGIPQLTGHLLLKTLGRVVAILVVDGWLMAVRLPCFLQVM